MIDDRRLRSLEAQVDALKTREKDSDTRKTYDQVFDRAEGKGGTSIARYRDHYDRNRGRDRIGAKNPPICAPVLRMLPAAPTCSPASSVTDAQKGPSQQAARPTARDRQATATPILELTVPA